MSERRFVRANDVQVGDHLLLWDGQTWVAGGIASQIWRQGGRVGIVTVQDGDRVRTRLHDPDDWVAIKDQGHGEK